MSEFASIPSNPEPSIPPTQTPDAKILSDLATVVDKINLCSSMLQPLTSTSQIEQEESLLAIIGFLEACVPRVRELIEAGMTGALAEDTVVKCFTVNDSLCQVLEFVEHPEKCEPAPAQRNPDPDVDVPVGSFDAFGITDDNDLNLFGGKDTSTRTDDADKKPMASAPATTSAASSALEDLLLTPTEAPTTTTTDAATFNEQEFDDFFNDRVGDDK